MNQLSCGLDMISLAADWLLSVANTNAFTYEIAPVFVVTEGIVLAKLRTFIGWENPVKSGDGIFSPGGSVNNFIAGTLARSFANKDIKRKGIYCTVDKPLVMFVSSHAHYSNKRMGVLMGIGLDNVVSVPVSKNGKMDPVELKKLVQQSIDNGKKPFLVVATSGTTVRGAFDPLEEISEICTEFKLWLHVDAAWGGAVLMSRKYRYLMRGIEKADS